ncbi:hypothetical protein B0H17DRAFT_1152522 [Mycena rosella]|uniref:RPN1 N-terminal domain-containing protein n=1 Tax=Mycena rosella TaxID=1033263 RepID=A0AAD7BC51_MYCRO|nr:hypothetical protein B0H17DRAFT_1152522 [Mycena rosella]
MTTQMRRRVCKRTEGDQHGDACQRAPEAGKDKVPAKVELIGTIEDLHALAKECTVFLVGHNAEPDMVDLLERLEIDNEIAWLVDANTYNRIYGALIKIYVYHRKFPEVFGLSNTARCGMQALASIGPIEDITILKQLLRSSQS